MPKAKTRIENVVVSVTYEGTEFDLKKLARILDGANYNPERFPGISYRSEFPPR
ncbi:MAG: TATA-box-binding protein, partial [Hadesarchaea archaeon]|nr:TATA-box-binding protein [Hadesarchaea archaeon]